jgi:LPS export ABC transporter protein LptC
MRSWRLILLVVLFSTGAAALWFGSSRHGDGSRSGQAAETSQVAYDYEAHDVVLRQMGPDGRLAYQIEAREINQLPDSGRIAARGLTMYRDPPGTEPSGRSRWTVTADSGEVPADGGVVTLKALTLYHDPPGTEPGSQNRWTLTADRGELPVEGGVVTLSGRVRANGVPVGGTTAMSVSTNQLSYDMARQELSSEDDVQLTVGASTSQGRRLLVNIGTGSWQLESGNATFVP